MGERHDAVPQNIFNLCAETLQCRKLKFCDFQYKSIKYQKKLCVVPYNLFCYLNSEFVKEYLRFSQVNISYDTFPHSEISEVFKSKI